MKATTTPSLLAGLALVILASFASAGCANASKDPSDRAQDQIMNKRAEELLQRNDRFPRATRGDVGDPDADGARRKKTRN